MQIPTEIFENLEENFYSWYENFTVELNENKLLLTYIGTENIRDYLEFDDEPDEEDFAPEDYDEPEQAQEAFEEEVSYWLDSMQSAFDDLCNSGLDGPGYYVELVGNSPDPQGFVFVL